MKLSRGIRQNLDLIPDEGEKVLFYASQAEPLARRGLIEWEYRDVQITVSRPVARLTDLGRRVKYQNTDD